MAKYDLTLKVRMLAYGEYGGPYLGQMGLHGRVARPDSVRSIEFSLSKERMAGTYIPFAYAEGTLALCFEGMFTFSGYASMVQEQYAPCPLSEMYDADKRYLLGRAAEKLRTGAPELFRNLMPIEVVGRNVRRGFSRELLALVQEQPDHAWYHNTDLFIAQGEWITADRRRAPNAAGAVDRDLCSRIAMSPEVLRACGIPVALITATSP